MENRAYAVAAGLFVLLLAAVTIAGAVWFGGTFNANTGGEQSTATQKLQVVSKGGGRVDSVNLTFHVTAQPNNIVVKDFDFGTCAAP